MSIMLKGDELRQAFLAYYQASKKGNKRPATLDEVKCFSERFLHFLDVRPFTIETIQSYLDTLLSVGIHNGRVWKLSSVKSELKIALKINRWMVEKKYMDNLFCSKDFELPIEDDDEEINLAELPSIEIAQQIIILATTPGSHDHALHRQQKQEMRDAFDFMLRTGIRVGELRKLVGADLILGAETPSYKVRAEVSKSRKSALLPLSQAVDMLDMLRKRQANKILFQVNADSMNRALKRGCKKYGWAGKQLTNHSLRHIFACNCAKNGMPDVELCRLLRHSSIEITNKYYLHYNVKELSASLHRHNDLMKECQSVQQVFDNARSLFESSGIVTDSRFIYQSVMNRTEMLLRVKVK